MIAIVDYGEGNLGSVEKALRHVGCDAVITSDAEALSNADGLVLPGVGAFDDCICSLRETGLEEPLKKAIADGTPFLGICLGLQMLFESSEEGELPGLGVLRGTVPRFDHDLKIPQIGWNRINIQKDAPHLDGVEDGSWVYFVHSYYVDPEDETIITTTTDYGIEFCSAVWKDNIFATQFHPEKSQKVGLQILDNFRQIVAGEK
ncbi:MAG: imidazole glycerol phosphate synthase subunit HisH [Armatimonadota bacterium]